MTNDWTKEDIEQILIQLQSIASSAPPFSKYRFTCSHNSLKLLGCGASSQVYEASSLSNPAKKYAIKVTGFGDALMDSGEFRRIFDLQQELGQVQKNVIRVFKASEIQVWIEGDHTVTKAVPLDVRHKNAPGENCLTLQFLVMEKLSPILQRTHGSAKLLPPALRQFDEQEFLKFAHDITNALSAAHQKKILHRDVKLENIFYSPQTGEYKLGDFGISKAASSGLASTVVFTKGYGAPEVVGMLEDNYDSTADIYSLGMTLFLLLNELCFPDSSGYRANLPAQYAQGYVLPRPANGSEGLYRMVRRMCSFDPNDRYQSMEEVQNDLEQLRYGSKIKYRREHRNLPLVLSAASSLAGSAMWKLFVCPELQLHLSFLSLLFPALCVGKGALKIFRRKTAPVSLLILLSGFCLLAAGFSWQKLLVLLCLSLLSGVGTGLFGCGMLLIHLICLLTGEGLQPLPAQGDFRWLAALSFSLAAALLIYYGLSIDRDYFAPEFFSKRNIFWGIAALFYLSLICTKYSLARGIWFPSRLLLHLFGQPRIDAFLSWRPELIGLCGLIFCLVWTAREHFLFRRRSHSQKNL